MLEAKNINFSYRRGIPVLKDINCKIDDGEFVAERGVVSDADRHGGSRQVAVAVLMLKAFTVEGRPAGGGAPSGGGPSGGGEGDRRGGHTPTLRSRGAHRVVRRAEPHPPAG